MSDPYTKYQMTVQNGTAQVTTTDYSEDGRPLDGHTESFNSQEEAETYMNKKTDPQTTVDTKNETTPIDNNTVTEQEMKGETLGVQDGVEKPASQMSEADAVALNSDVHVATPSQSPRVVTQGQIDQVDTGLHADATEGKPLVKEDDSNKQDKPQEPAEDLHVRAPSK